MAKPQNAATPLSGVSSERNGPHPVDVHVGGRVKLRRLVLGLSQESLGNSLGLTFQQVQKYEKGVNRIGASRMFEISKLLEVPVQFFFEEFGDSQSSAHGFSEEAAADPVMGLLSSSEGIQLCRYFSGIKDPVVKKRVLDLVKSIAETEGAEFS